MQTAARRSGGCRRAARTRRTTRAAASLIDGWTTEESPYETLEVDPFTATTEDLKSAFRAKAKELHPDSGGASASQEAFVKLKAAYDLLSDARAR